MSTYGSIWLAEQAWLVKAYLNNKCGFNIN